GEMLPRGLRLMLLTSCERGTSVNVNSQRSRMRIRSIDYYSGSVSQGGGCQLCRQAEDLFKAIAIH
ncbi:hypothetical protein ALC62_15313, partial [Cyphomyrmex costatus]